MLTVHTNVSHSIANIWETASAVLLPNDSLSITSSLDGKVFPQDLGVDLWKFVPTQSKELTRNL